MLLQGLNVTISVLVSYQSPQEEDAAKKLDDGRLGHHCLGHFECVKPFVILSKSFCTREDEKELLLET